jgi:hypothetical protein
MRIFGGISIGATLGIYLFGVLVPWFNSKVNKKLTMRTTFLLTSMAYPKVIIR